MPALTLNSAEKRLIKFDAKCLGDLGLQMPRITAKYWAAVQALARIQNTSSYFMHVAEARQKGSLYHWLADYGYVWDGTTWRKPHTIKTAS